MSYDENSVQDAAAYLDKWHTNKNWRSLINLAILDMGSVDNCILGQLFDSYYDGVDTLRNLSGREEFAKVGDAFADYDSDWKKYLLNSSVDDWKGAEWVNRYPYHSVKKATTDHLFTIDSVDYVVWNPIDGPIRVNTREAFEADFKRKPATPKYNEGRLYTGREGVVLMFGAEIYHGKPGFYFLNEGTYCNESYFESTYGPLKPIEAALNNGKAVVAKIG